MAAPNVNEEDVDFESSDSAEEAPLDSPPWTPGSPPTTPPFPPLPSTPHMPASTWAYVEPSTREKLANQEGSLGTPAPQHSTRQRAATPTPQHSTHQLAVTPTPQPSTRHPGAPRPPPSSVAPLTSSSSVPAIIEGTSPERISRTAIAGAGSIRWGSRLTSRLMRSRCACKLTSRLLRSRFGCTLTNRVLRSRCGCRLTSRGLRSQRSSLRNILSTRHRERLWNGTALIGQPGPCFLRGAVLNLGL